MPVSEVRPTQETIALSRSHIYGMLARIYLREADLPLLQELQRPRLAVFWRAAGLASGREALAGPPAEVLEELAVEYARLFVGPGPHVSLYESVHAGQRKAGEKGLLMGEAAVRVRELVEGWGYRYEPGLKIMPDHLAVELQLMQHLSAAEAECWARQDASQALLCRLRQQQLLDEHLRRWVPKFCREVLAARPHRLYQAATALLLELVTTDSLGEVEAV